MFIYRNLEDILIEKTLVKWSYFIKRFWCLEMSKVLRNMVFVSKDNVDLNVVEPLKQWFRLFECRPKLNVWGTPDMVIPLFVSLMHGCDYESLRSLETWFVVDKRRGL